MAVSETQLETWSHQGSKVQSAATYETVRAVLEDRSAPYAARYFDVFLQGSYGNDTNIFADSDVDIVMCLTSVYYDDVTELEESQRSLYNANFSAASYSLPTFRNEVLTWLRSKFGNNVVNGKKAIRINGNGSRRDADVLVCAEYRRYFTYLGGSNAKFARGVVFWTTDGTKIVNYPEQHRDNCSSKHQDASFRFKPTVRVMKNYRNALVNGGLLREGVAPSYFLEGLLWNMPNTRFHSSFTHTMNFFIDWVRSANSSELLCANERYYLVRDGSAVCWNSKDYRTYVEVVQADW